MRWLLSLATALVVVACGPEGPVDREAAASLEIPDGTQQVWCAGRGPGVVLLSGIGDRSSSRQWVDVQDRLSEDARVCRYDRPGTGVSPPPTRAGRGPDVLGLELDAVVDHTTDREVVLVAHSFGGYLARLYADRHPERVRGIVFVDALDPSVGLLRGTGADGLSEVAMADEGLDLRALERAAAGVEALPADISIAVLVRDHDVTPAWMEGQQGLAELSPRSDIEVVAGASHQIPTDAPQAVVDAVLGLLG